MGKCNRECLQTNTSEKRLAPGCSWMCQRVALTSASCNCCCCCRHSCLLVSRTPDVHYEHNTFWFWARWSRRLTAEIAGAFVLQPTFPCWPRARLPRRYPTLKRGSSVLPTISHKHFSAISQLPLWIKWSGRCERRRHLLSAAMRNHRKGQMSQLIYCNSRTLLVFSHRSRSV